MGRNEDRKSFFSFSLNFVDRFYVSYIPYILWVLVEDMLFMHNMLLTNSTVVILSASSVMLMLT